jgi:hypothetical protein
MAMDFAYDMSATCRAVQQTASLRFNLWLKKKPGTPQCDAVKEELRLVRLNPGFMGHVILRGWNGTTTYTMGLNLWLNHTSLPCGAMPSRTGHYWLNKAPLKEELRLVRLNPGFMGHVILRGCNGTTNYPMGLNLWLNKRPFPEARCLTSWGSTFG